MPEEPGKRQTVGRLNMKRDRWLTSSQQHSREEAQQGAMVSDLFDHEGHAIEFRGIWCSCALAASWSTTRPLYIGCFDRQKEL